MTTFPYPQTGTMRTRDVFRSAVGGLWRQKARTTLTLGLGRRALRRAARVQPVEALQNE